MRTKVLIAGGNGMVGTRFMSMFSEKYHFHVLTRTPHVNTEKVSYFQWDLDKMQIDESALDVDIIINLAGEGIADKRWTIEQKQKIVDSRVNSCHLLKQSLDKKSNRASLYINASAIGFYGDRKDELLTENSLIGQGFLSEACQDWEAAAMNLKSACDRHAIIRIGIVLSKNGGALPKMMMTKPFGFLSYFGDGYQYYSWIHLDDLCRLINFLIDDQKAMGIYNAVSPIPLTNKEFVREIKQTLESHAMILPAPKLALEMTMGEMAHVVLDSAKVSSEKIQSLGFLFQFTKLKDAIVDLYRSTN